MAIIPDGGTLTIPSHRVSRIELQDLAHGTSLTNIEVQVSPVRGLPLSIEVLPGNSDEERVLSPLRLGPTTLWLDADGHPSSGVRVPLSQQITVVVAELLATRFFVTYTLGGTPPGDPQPVADGGAIDLPDNRTGILTIVGRGPTGQVVALTGQGWASDDVNVCTVAPDPNDASVGIITPTSTNGAGPATVTFTAVCGEDDNGPVTVTRTVEVTLRAATINTFQVDADFEDPA
jgi:hypothetical protein